MHACVCMAVALADACLTPLISALYRENEEASTSSTRGCRVCTALLPCIVCFHWLLELWCCRISLFACCRSKQVFAVYFEQEEYVLFI
jgi:hypothetical protein